MQIASILGAVLILAAYGAHQGGWLGRDTASYHLLNVAGGVALCAVAIDARQIGFIILEGAWTLISLAALATMRRRRPAGA